MSDAVENQAAEPVQLSLADIQTFVQIIDLCSTRGAFKGQELEAGLMSHDAQEPGRHRKEQLPLRQQYAQQPPQLLCPGFPPQGEHKAIPV